VELEDVGPVVVADRIDRESGGHHRPEVEVGHERLLAFANQPGEDLASRADEGSSRRAGGRPYLRRGRRSVGPLRRT